MANLVEKLMSLERRLMAVEKVLGITPPLADLMHPKALRQNEIRLAALVAAQKTEKTS